MMSYIDRPEYLNWLAKWRGHDIVKVLTGVRRCGKSTILEMYRSMLVAQGVEAEQIISINLENPDTEKELGSGLCLYNYVKDRCGDETLKYVFIDEAQHLEEFERTIAGLGLLPSVDLYITGSNSHFLSRDLADRLTGRYVELHVLPLSFREYMSAPPLDRPDEGSGGGKPGRAAIDPLQTYLDQGGFPFVRRIEGDRQMAGNYLRDVLNTIILKDIAPRQSSFSPTLFDSVLSFVFDNIGNLSTVNKISDTLTSMGRKTGRTAVENYVSGMVDSFLVYPARRYDLRGKMYLEHSTKNYVVDTGMRRALLGSRNPDYGHVLENAVFLELLRRGDKVSVGRIDRSEVDFLADGPTGLTYIQVSQTVDDPAVLERELAPLRAIPDHHPRLLLVGVDRPAVLHEGIRQLSVRDWLLGET
ncbi:MAG: ATP-binding protein [Acidobacteriota bacterium]|nr:ATP-binding protein [Acidobacteriota bacterium]